MSRSSATAIRARSELYSWLAAALHIPDDAIVSTGFAEAGKTAWRSLFPGTSTAPLDALDRASREASRSLEAVQREYARLFLGPPRALIHPYESCYFGENRLMTAQTVAVDAFLKEYGVARDPMGVREPVDHIAVELEFLAIVCSGELEAGQSTEALQGGPEEIEHRFLCEHLGRWGRLVAHDIAAATNEPLYLAAAWMLDRLLEQMTEEPA